MKVVVASLSNIKIGAVRSALEAREVIGVKTDSRVPEQPVGDETVEVAPAIARLGAPPDGWCLMRLVHRDREWSFSVEERPSYVDKAVCLPFQDPAWNISSTRRW